MVIDAPLKICERGVYVDSNSRDKFIQRIAKSPLKFSVQLVHDIVDFYLCHSVPPPSTQVPSF